MTGPEHYRSAEKILEALGQITKDNGGVPVAIATGLLAEAQVHATLALAATGMAFDTNPPAAPLCDCGAPIPAPQRKAYCSDRCRWADDDHGPDTEPTGDES